MKVTTAVSTYPSRAIRPCAATNPKTIDPNHAGVLLKNDTASSPAVLSNPYGKPTVCSLPESHGTLCSRAKTPNFAMLDETSPPSGAEIRDPGCSTQDHIWVTATARKAA